MAEKIVLVPYHSKWPDMFEVMKQELLSAVGECRVEDIQHIGSTAVPGLAAKPVIDILMGVSRLEVADAHCIEPIVGIGFHYRKSMERHVPFRRYFTKEDTDGNRTHQIHLVETKHEWWENHLLFRDYLRAHDETRDAYENLKHELAKDTYEKTTHYADRKTEFVTGVLKKARLWKQNMR